MALTEGEYEFTCDECNGDGSLQYIRAAVDEAGDETDEAELVWDKCDDCYGDGTVTVDDKVAAEKIEYGQTPIRTPSSS
ncbi:hypothetical protein [Streptomyces sp. NPDC007074]|uniref:hypothetical protein n=1 Tax=Streptomyces sp. NPDC007074 TaxID=3156764 RepID=UPI0033EBD2B7